MTLTTRYFADLHIHSRFSRATSKQCDLPHLAQWACKKGLALVATGDFTHPAWRAELREQLVPAGPGVFRLRDDLQRAVDQEVPPSCRATPRFLLSVEISSIYKKGDRTRKVHHVIYAPDLDTADNLVQRLERIGNLHSDGRPILGLDSRDLLEMVLESGPDAYLIPAHVWTPWFAALGSRSGFDSVDECYGDLAEHIFAVETGLSSDPPMNWRVGSLDRFRLVSNSDAHSPSVLGRNACCFDTDVDYFAVRRALATGDGYVGTVDMYPEEGKYHLDGHRKCGVRLEPRETLAAGGRCPACGRPLTVGVMHRVELLADREQGCATPATAGELCYLIPLTEILSELLQVGPKSRKVSRVYERLLRRLGPELPLLTRTPAEELQRAESPLLARAVTRLRGGRVFREAGYDGEFGAIRLFEDGEVDRAAGGELLFELPRKKAKQAPVLEAPAPAPAPPRAPATSQAADAPASGAPLDGLDPDQRAAAEVTEGPLLIVAGPGSGKTRTLTHRIAHLITENGVEPRRCLAITFTRRAAEEMRTRLDGLIPEVARQVPVHTFHGLGLTILQQHAADAGLPTDFRVADEAERAAMLVQEQSLTETRARRLLKRLSTARRGAAPDGDLEGPLQAYLRGLRGRGWVDFDDLVMLAVELLERRPGVAATWRDRHPHLSIDEYQDVDAQQVRLVRALAPASSRGSLCAIGDPDQAIYGFRGSDVRHFQRFADDFPGTRVFRLTRNYRSSGPIVHGAAGMIGAGDQVQRRVEVMLDDPERISLHEAPTSKAEAEFVVVTLERILGGHSFFSRDSGRGDHANLADLSFSDVGVLYRTEAQADDLVEALARSGMPFQRHTHEPLASQPGVEELVDRLRHDSSSGPVIDRLDRASHDDDAQRATAAALLRPLARSCGADLQRLFTEIALGATADCWDPRADRISLLTLHAAKGLQFDVVFVVGCSDGLLPLAFGPAAAADLDEERRLFYVGMTRAKRRLLLCRAHRARHLGKLRELPPSPFLLDIEQRLLERRESTAKRKKKKPSDDQMRLFR